MSKNIAVLPIQFKAFGSYLPELRINNDSIMSQFGLKQSGNLLARAVGSREKRVLEKDRMGSDMLAKIGNVILEKAKIEKNEVQRLICSCDPTDHSAPDSSVVAQHKIGLTCPSFGVSMSCVGWLCGVSIASQFILSGGDNILVLSSSTVGSKFHFNSPMHRAIFGDGAGGALLGRATKPSQTGQIVRVDLFSVGQFYKKIFAPNPWTNVPEEIPAAFKNSFYMSPDNEVFFKALEQHIYPFYKKQYDITGLTTDDIDLFIVHQASMPLFNHTVDFFKIPRDRTMNLFEHYGNTISAELPIYMDRAINDGLIKPGSLVYLLTYGAGFTAGAMILKF